jgi:hypothetical protein
MNRTWRSSNLKNPSLSKAATGIQGFDEVTVGRPTPEG